MQEKITIDQDKCIGCGQCEEACNNGFINIIKGKAYCLEEITCNSFSKCLNKCPTGAISFISVPTGDKEYCAGGACDDNISELYNWPIKLKFTPYRTRYLNKADLLICADCAGYLVSNLHTKYLYDKVLLIACAKDDYDLQLKKLTVILTNNDIKSIEILHADVLCCHDLTKLILEARTLSKKNLPITEKILDIDGNCKTTNLL
ncbi:MAG: 4Fe-4S binding protein [Erysipelotrichaceae bacterium]